MKQLAVDGYTKWAMGDQDVGEFKHHGNFTFLRVYQAGHMVPMDQPEVSLEMFKKFLNKEF